MSSVAVNDAGDSTTPHEVENCRGVLRVFSDGSIIRSSNTSFPVPIHDDGTVEWKDVLFDAALGLHLRLYRRHGTAGKLPIFYHLHGGGFCIGSRTWPNFQNLCLRLSGQLSALVVAPDYRLAPEHRLPAAIDDGISVLRWLRSQATSSDPDPWLAESADFGRVFVSGDSSGGNIAHHLAVRFGSPGGRDELSPVRVRGHALLMPFFGGAHRTKSEAECPEDAFLNLEQNDRYWRLSLPHGATADHPLSNPFGPESPSLDPVEVGPVLVVVGGKDLLRDRTAEYARRLKAWRKPAELVEFEGEQHGFYGADPRSKPLDELMGIIERFVDDNSRST